MRNKVEIALSECERIRNAAACDRERLEEMQQRLLGDLPWYADRALLMRGNFMTHGGQVARRPGRFSLPIWNIINLIIIQFLN